MPPKTVKKKPRKKLVKRVCKKGGAANLNSSAKAFLASSYYSDHPEKKEKLDLIVQNPNFYWDPKNPNLIYPNGDGKFRAAHPFLFLDHDWYGTTEAWKRGLTIALDLGKAAYGVATDPENPANYVKLGQQVKTTLGSGRTIKKRKGVIGKTKCSVCHMCGHNKSRHK